MEKHPLNHASAKKYYTGEQLQQLPLQDINFYTSPPESLAQRFTEDERLSLLINSFVVSKSSLPAHYYYIGYLNYQLGAAKVFQQENIQKGYKILLACTALLTNSQKEILQRRMEIHHDKPTYEKIAENTLDAIGITETEDEEIEESDLMTHGIQNALTRFRDSYSLEVFNGYVTWATGNNVLAIERNVFPYINILAQQNPSKTLNYLRSSADALGLMYRATVPQDPQSYFNEGEQILKNSGYRNVSES